MKVWLNSPYGFMRTALGDIKNGTMGEVYDKDFSTTKKVSVRFGSVAVYVPCHWLDTTDTAAKGLKWPRMK